MPFTLDVDTLGGLFAASTRTTCEDVGQSLVLKWSQGGFDQDLELFGFAVELTPTESVAYDAQQVDLATLLAYSTGLYGSGTYGGPGGITGIFILDLSTLGTLSISTEDIPIIDRGRNIQITLSQSGFNQDLEDFGFGIRFAPAEAELASDNP